MTWVGVVESNFLVFDFGSKSNSIQGRDMKISENIIIINNNLEEGCGFWLCVDLPLVGSLINRI